MNKISPDLISIRDTEYFPTAERNSLCLRQYYNYPWLFIINDKAAILPSGEDDHIEFFSEDDEVILLTINHRMGYAGLDVYDQDLESVGMVFFQNVTEELSEDFFNLGYEEQINQLIQYI